MRGLTSALVLGKRRAPGNQKDAAPFGLGPTLDKPKRTFLRPPPFCLNQTTILDLQSKTGRFTIGDEKKEKSKLSASVAWWCTNAGLTLLLNQ